MGKDWAVFLDILPPIHCVLFDSCSVVSLIPPVVQQLRLLAYTEATQVQVLAGGLYNERRLPRSSSGPGHSPLKAKTGVQFPYGVLWFGLSKTSPTSCATIAASGGPSEMPLKIRRSGTARGAASSTTITTRKSFPPRSSGRTSIPGGSCRVAPWPKDEGHCLSMDVA